MKYQIINIDNTTVLDLEFVKSYIRIKSKEDDFLIHNMINTAIEFAENYLNIALFVKKIIVIAESSIVELPLTPLLEISVISINNSIIKASEYELYKDSVILKNSISSQDRVTIEYKAGYQKAENIPYPIITGMMLHIVSMYDSRFGDVSPSQNILQLYNSYKKIRF